MNNLLHPLRSNVFQVVINGTVAAVLHVADETKIFVLADKPRLLATVPGFDIKGVAHRIANGEFDNDFRYEIDRNPEPDQPSEMYFMTCIGIPSQKVLESFTTDDPGREVEAAREAQEYSLEERLGAYGLEWQREQADRGRWS